MISAQSQTHYLFFFVLVIVCAILYTRSAAKQQFQTSSEFKDFQRWFLAVYFCAFMADWLRGPYLFKIFREAGLHSHSIALLYIAQFSADLLFGTFFGALADKWGRRNNCLMYGIVYAISMLTLHSETFYILLIGRILAGISTSILYSAFESWMVQRHREFAYPDEWCSRTFEIMTLGNSVLAIVAGVLAFILTETSQSYLAPSDLSLVFLFFSTFMVFLRWDKNIGTASSGNLGLIAGVQQACSVFCSNSKVALLGIIQSCFEAPTLILLYIWTPALEDVRTALKTASMLKNELSSEQGDNAVAQIQAEVAKEKLLGAVGENSSVGIPHGLIFACFMVSVMIGSLIFNALGHQQAVQKTARIVYVIAAASFAVPVFFSGHWIRLVAFCVFNVCVGLHYPCIGTLRAMQIQGEVRTTVMNMFRIGLNVIAIAIIHNIDITTNERQGERQTFAICAILLTVATLAQHRLAGLINNSVVDDQDLTEV